MASYSENFRTIAPTFWRPFVMCTIFPFIPIIVILTARYGQYCPIK